MKAKQHYQDSQIHLEPEKEYQIGDVLGQWLVDNKKAVLVVKQPEQKPQPVQVTETPPQVEEVKPQKFKRPQRGYEVKHD